MKENKEIKEKTSEEGGCIELLKLKNDYTLISYKMEHTRGDIW